MEPLLKGAFMGVAWKSMKGACMGVIQNPFEREEFLVL